MTEWVGFTDADLQRMKGGGEPPNKPKIIKPLTGGRPKPGSAMGQRQQRRPNTKNGQKQPTRAGQVPQAALLSKPAANEAEKEPQQKIPPTPPGTPNDQIPLHGKTFPPIHDHEPNKTIKVEDLGTGPKEPEIVDDDEVIQKKEKLKLEDIQRRQKEMEEKNKRKKTMLTKAIAERRKRASAESTKLVKIQAELAKLDGMLNYDVSILRDKIDEACWEFNNAQKRFEKAETEYVDAKLSLHKATEVKEELTEHLYHLIQLNEERKASKLEELMHKLDMEDQEEETAEKIDENGHKKPEPEITSGGCKPDDGKQPNSAEIAEIKETTTRETETTGMAVEKTGEDSKVDPPS